MIFPKKAKQFNSNENFEEIIVLDDRVDDIVKWYKNNILKGSSTDIEQYFIKTLRDVIEKMAAWYEMKYSDYDVNRIMFDSNQEDNASNFDTFLKLLSEDEKYFFRKYRYPEIVYFNLKIGCGHLHLYEDGIVEIDEFSYKGCKGEGKHIKEVVENAIASGIDFPTDSEMLKVIEKDKNKDKLIDEVLNVVMYRLIERGGSIMGPRRAYLFAKEFKRNLDIPIMYGIDTSDSHLREFVNKYLNDGGNPDLVCYMDYSSWKGKHQSSFTMSIREILKSKWYNAKEFYTPEETELHQRLVNVLSRKLEK